MTSPASSSLADADAVERAAVELGDDGVLRDVDETAREVTGVRRLERGVGEALTSAVRRDEVLRARVRPSRKFAVIGVSMISPEGLAIRPRMAASWRICCVRAARAGVGHDVDRVEARLDLLVSPVSGSIDRLLADAVHHLARRPVGDAGPDVDDLVVALAVGDQTFLVLLDDALDLVLRLVEQLLLRRPG